MQATSRNFCEKFSKERAASDSVEGTPGKRYKTQTIIILLFYFRINAHLIHTYMPSSVCMCGECISRELNVRFR